MEERVASEREALTARHDGVQQDEIDWEAIEASPEFQELVRKRRAFVVPATIFYLSWYMGFILLTAYAKDFMSERVYQGLTVGYCLALTQFVMVVVLGLMYLKRAEKVFDPLAERAIERWTHLDTDERRARLADGGTWIETGRTEERVR